MAEYNDDRTVVVERDTRDTADRSSPVGLIILVVALLALAFFLLLGGAQMFNGDSTDDPVTPTDGTNSPVDTPTTAPTPTPTTDEPTVDPGTEQ